MAVGNISTNIQGADLKQVQAVRAKQSLENLKKIYQSKKVSNEQSEENKVKSQQVQSKTNINLNETETIQLGATEKYMQEIKNFANKHNIESVDDDDIKYALRYGTSLLADYKA